VDCISANHVPEMPKKCLRYSVQVGGQFMQNTLQEPVRLVMLTIRRDNPIINLYFISQEVRGMNHPEENCMAKTVILVSRRGKSVHIENDFAAVWGKSAHFSASFVKLQNRSVYSAVFNASHSGSPV